MKAVSFVEGKGVEQPGSTHGWALLDMPMARAILAPQAPGVIESLAMCL
jgi:hypothetical protein